MASSSFSLLSPIWSKRTRPSAPTWMRLSLVSLRLERGSAVGSFVPELRATLSSGPSRHGGPSPIGTVPWVMSSLARRLFLSPSDRPTLLYIPVSLSVQALDIPFYLLSSLPPLIVILLLFIYLSILFFKTRCLCLRSSVFKLFCRCEYGTYRTILMVWSALSRCGPALNKL